MNGTAQARMDDEIVSRLRNGQSEEAFALLVPAYRRRVHSVAYAVLRDRAAAEDVAQEVFVKLWRVLDTFDGRAQLSTWIYTIARNAAIGTLRRRRQEVSLSEPAVESAAEAATLERVGEEAGAARDEVDAALLRAIDGLPDRQREAVTLYYLQERSTDEVAEMLGMPVNTVKTHLHRARARLAAVLQDARPEEAAA